MLPFTREFGFLAVSECKRFLIYFVVCVDIQLIVPCRPYPLGWHAGTVARELPVSHLCIVLLRLYELVIDDFCLS